MSNIVSGNERQLEYHIWNLILIVEFDLRDTWNDEQIDARNFVQYVSFNA